MNIKRDDFWNDELLAAYCNLRSQGKTINSRYGFAKALEKTLKQSIFALADLQKELIRREGVKGSMRHCQLGDSGASNADFEWCELDYSTYSIEDLKRMQDSWAVELYPGEKISIAASDRINDELQFVGSTLYLISGMFTGYREVLLGHCKKMTEEDNTQYVEVIEEHAKTPGVADNIASLAKPGLYAVLVDGCARVAKMKYQPSLNAALSNINDQRFPRTLSTLQERLNRALFRSYIKRLGRDEGRLTTAVAKDVVLQSQLYCRGQLSHHLQLGLDKVALNNALGTHLKSLEFGTDTLKLKEFRSMAAVFDCGADTSGPVSEINSLAQKNSVRAREMLLMFLSDAIFTDLDGQYEEKSLMLLTAFLPCVCGNELRLDELDRAVKWWKDYTNYQFIDFLTEIQALVLTARHFTPPDSNHVIERKVIETQLDKFVSDSATEPMAPMEKKKNFAYLNAIWSNRLMLMGRLALDDYEQLVTRVFEFVFETNVSIVSGIHPEWNGKKTDLRGIVDNLCRETI